MNDCKVTTIREFSELRLDDQSVKSHLLRNWPVNRFLSCLQVRGFRTVVVADAHVAYHIHN